MITRPAPAILLLSLAFCFVRAAELRFVQEGVEVDAASMGRFTIEFPKLTDGAQKVLHKLVEQGAATKTATLKYEGGASITLTLAEGGKIRCALSHLPADVKSIDLDMHIPISFNQGGRWKLGDRQGAFPVQKPANPHLYQGHAPMLEISNYEGRSLTVRAPEYSFLQLTDNREWNWPIFHWKAITPVDSNRRDLEIVVGTSGDGATAKPLVDRFGQSTLSDWPDKVKTGAELETDVESEKAYYASLRPPPADAFGGLPGSREKFGLKATGFFHVEKKSDRWLLVDPEGNAFFHLGLCGFNPNDDYTRVKGRESAYEWLPEREGEFGSAFRKDSGGAILSFHLANQIRKYGRPFSDEDYAARMIARLRQLGFNSIGAFTSLEFGASARKAAQFPCVAHLPLNQWEGIPRIPGIHETFDPFDEKTRALVEAKLAGYLPAHAVDPLIIGWFVVNEPIYEEIPHIVPSLKSSAHACKRRFLEWLGDKYKEIAAFNTAWEAHYQDFDELREIGLAVKSNAAIRDSEEFAALFLDEYYRLVAGVLRRHDPNHMLLGSRLQPGTIDHEWISRVMGRYVDIMSFNYYTYAVDRDLLKRIYGWTGGRPMMLSEFFWSSPRDTGLAGGREVGSQRERGLAYRNYVEQSASPGFVVGVEWFTLVDQSVTGRWFSGFDGERANTGLISVTDRPWKAMLKEMMKTNHDIYRVWFGEKEPFAFEDARFKATP